MGGEASPQVCVPWPASSARPGLGRGPGPSGLGRGPTASVACGQREALLSPPPEGPTSATLLGPLGRGEPFLLLVRESQALNGRGVCLLGQPWSRGLPTPNSPPKLEEDWKGGAQQVPTVASAGVKRALACLLGSISVRASREVCSEPAGPLPTPGPGCRQPPDHGR